MGSTLLATYLHVSISIPIHVCCILILYFSSGTFKRTPSISSRLPLSARNSEGSGDYVHGHTFFSTTTRPFRFKR